MSYLSEKEKLFSKEDKKEKLYNLICKALEVENEILELSYFNDRTTYRMKPLKRYCKGDFSCIEIAVFLAHKIMYKIKEEMGEILE